MRAGKEDAYQRALDVMVPGTREWWLETLEEWAEEPEPDYEATDESLSEWLEEEAVTYFRKREVELANREMIREHAQQYTVEALEGLAQIARTSESDAAKVSAWKAILDRGHGRPAQAVQVGADPDSAPVVYVMRFGDGLKEGRDGAEIDHAGVGLSPHAGPVAVAAAVPHQGFWCL